MAEAVAFLPHTTLSYATGATLLTAAKNDPAGLV
jgi:hypothetical protein